MFIREAPEQDIISRFMTMLPVVYKGPIHSDLREWLHDLGPSMTSGFWGVRGGVYTLEHQQNGSMTIVDYDSVWDFLPDYGSAGDDIFLFFNPNDAVEFKLRFG